MSNSTSSELRALQDRVLHLELDVKLINHLVQHHSGVQPAQVYQPPQQQAPIQRVQSVEPTQPIMAQPMYQQSVPPTVVEPEVEPVDEPEEEVEDEPTDVDTAPQSTVKVPEPEVVEGTDFKDTIMKSLAKNLSSAMGMVVLSGGAMITSWIQGSSYKPPEAPKDVAAVTAPNNQK